MIRLLRTIGYWARCVFRPSTVRWTLRDNDEWEWACWGQDA